MARMIPTALPDNVKSNAEKDLFKLFRDAPGTEDWIVLYSVIQFNNPNVVTGESDFIVLAPGYGNFVIEVKGGRVERTSDGWCFIDGAGNVNMKQRGPFEQAKDGQYAVLNYIKDHYRPTNSFVRDLPTNSLFGFGVMFPDIDISDKNYGIDVERKIIYGKGYRQDVRQYIVDLSEYWQNHFNMVHDWCPRVPTVADCQHILETIRPVIDLVPTMNTVSGKLNEKLNALTKQEYQIVDAIRDNPRLLLHGNAGTGKTLVALELARRSEKNNIVFLCFNKRLAQFLNNYVNALHIEDKFLYIGTFHGLMLQKIKEAGLPLEYDRWNNESFYDTDLYYHFADALMKLQNFHTDLLIVDEFQDLLDEKGDIMDLFDLFLKEGIRRGSFALFGDFVKQNIYKKSLDLDTVKDLVSRNQTVGVTYFRLTQNCRNSKEICADIERVSNVKYDNLLDETAINANPEYQEYSSQVQECKAIHKLIDKLIKEKGLKAKSIVVLSPYTYENSCLVNGEKIPQYDFQRKGVTFSTIHSFKGLESDCIILADIEGYETDQDNSLAYIGMSRARAYLFVFESETARAERIDLLLSRM